MRQFGAWTVVVSLLVLQWSPATGTSSTGTSTSTNPSRTKQERAAALHQELLSKATLVEDRRTLQDADDFYSNDNAYSFSGYSLKYTKCQPVQYFSADAIAAGEHSPMITEDIVLLRLCSACSSSSLGCQSNYADYAMSVAQYVRILLQYSDLKQQAACAYCSACGYVASTSSSNGDGRKLEDAADQDNYDQAADNGNANGNGNGNANEEQQQQQQQQEQGDAADAQDSGANYQDCSLVDSICPNYTCDDSNNNNYLDYDGYMNYLDCAQVNYNGYAYFVQPHCDGESGTIKMAVFYDNYCASYAGSEVSIKNLGVGFREGFFQDYYSGECIDCSSGSSTSTSTSTTTPFQKLNNALCNYIHDDAAKCTTDLQYADVSGEVVDSTECSYIESLRHGTYDSKGKLSYSNGVIDWDSEVTPTQLSLLICTSVFCVAFLVYACYLHHSMTNLLIKSLSHRELLPPSRHVKRPIV